MSRLFQGDCREVLKGLPSDSVDVIVTDPPYELGFMGKEWDGSKVAHNVALWEQCLRVLKPGGHLLAFGGSRTYHRLACAIEDAGFEIRDQIMWVYGCLDEQTELVSENGVKQYRKAKIGERVLCYNPENGEYSYQPILEIVEYDYSDTAYRFVGDFGEQVVSRNHRCIIERDGGEVFQFAETLRSEACVPVLESLSELQHALSDLQSNPSGAEQILQPSMCQCADRESEQYADSVRAAQRGNGSLHSLREREVDAAVLVEEGRKADMQPQVQRSSQGRGMEAARPQRTAPLEARVGVCVEDSDDRRNQSGLEGGLDISESQRSLRRPADQICSLPVRVPEYGAERRLRDGASASCCADDRENADAQRVGSSPGSQCDEKRSEQPDAFFDERGAQGIRAWRGHKTALVRVVPFQYTGKMWCLRVPTGAFVAYRNGVAFPTGNSGFPKSLDVSKAIDKAAGAEREASLGISSCPNGKIGGYEGVRYSEKRKTRFGAVQDQPNRTNPATGAARLWSGWGTALKPAHEPIVVARKPLDGTVAANVLRWGTGAVNIEGCRVHAEDAKGYEYRVKRLKPGATLNKTGGNWRPEEGGVEYCGRTQDGRWPANLIHDGSEEVLACFPNTPGQLADTSTNSEARKTQNCYGAMKRGSHERSHDSDNNGTVGFKMKPGARRLDNGSAARFFYCAKASKSDRGVGNTHPTVKPQALMRYLCRLVTPPGGVVLDPFLGSGTTGVACAELGYDFIGIEREAESFAFAKQRIEAKENEYQEALAELLA